MNSKIPAKVKTVKTIIPASQYATEQFSVSIRGAFLADHWG
jgi:hypothetical protein